MSNDVVIAFHADGNIQHTLRDGVFKPELNAVREVERMSEIKHEKAIDSFYVLGKLDPIKGVFFDKDLADKYGVDIVTLGVPITLDRRGVCLFGSYEDAVKFEIRVIDAMRMQGLVIDHEPSSSDEKFLSGPVIDL